MAVRIGLIGAGGVALQGHIPGYKALGGQVELVALADVNPERAAAVAKEHGFARAYADYETMLAQEKLDAVSVCTPNKFHAPAVTAALEAGLHVLCEKPPGRNVAEAEAMAAAAARTGKLLMFGFNNRFRPETQMAKRFVDSADLGAIYAVRAKWLRRRGIPGWGVFTNKELQGGGALIDIGVHVLDLALHLMGYPEPELVVGSTYRHLGQRPATAPWGPWDHEHFEVEDMAMAFIKCKNGATIILESSFMEHMEPMDELSVRLSGTRGGLSLFPFKAFTDMHDAIVNITPAWVPAGDGYHLEVAHFVAAVRGETSPLITPAEGVILQRVIDAVYRSAATGAAVTL